MRFLVSQLEHLFVHPAALAFLALLPALALIGFATRRRRRQRLARFGNVSGLQPASWFERILGGLRVSWLAGGLALLCAAIAGPQWGRDWEQSAAQGRDLVVVLDMSRSMLAQDVLPSRLERARQAIEELSQAVQERGGHRLALVIFAARGKIVCPLTHDYDHFRTALRELDPNDLPAEIRPAGKDAPSGTRIGAGLAMAVQAQEEQFRGFQDILLISDGDDPAGDAEWRLGIQEARRFHIPVHTIGIGNPDQSSPIRLAGGGTLHYNQQAIQTRLEEQPLREIARATGGSYTPARTNTLPLGDLFRQRIEPGPAHEDTEEALPLYQQHYSWFLGAAFVLLSCEMMLGKGRAASRGEPSLVLTP